MKTALTIITTVAACVMVGLFGMLGQLRNEQVAAIAKINTRLDAIENYQIAAYRASTNSDSKLDWAGSAVLALNRQRTNDESYMTNDHFLITNLMPRVDRLYAAELEYVQNEQVINGKMWDWYTNAYLNLSHRITALEIKDLGR